MSRNDMSVAKVFEDDSEGRLPASQEEIDKYMVVVPECNDSDVLEDEPLTKRFKDDDSSDRAVDTVARRPRRAPSRVVGGRRVRLAKGITVDSGAADNVMPRRLLRGKSKVVPSEASREGVHYVAANGARIPNEGEAMFPFRTREGQPFSWLFQVAEVNKILASVSALVDSGHRVTFENDEDTGVDCSFITHKETGESIRMRRDNNVWVIDAYVDEEGMDIQMSSIDQGFRRQE